MFNKKSQPNLEQAPQAGQPQGPEIFVMPKLGKSRSRPPGAKMKKLPLPAIIGIAGGLLLLGFAGFGYFALKPRTEKLTEAPLGKEENQPAIKPEEPPVAPSVPATTTPEAPTVPEPPKPAEILSFGPDDDSDGLTNVEERLIYKSDPLRPDTDSDSFLDGNEVFHLYSPIGPIPVGLLGSGLVRQYENIEFNYNLFYPSEWVIKQADEEPRKIVIQSASGESISVTVSDNQSDESLFDWYSREARDGDVNSLETITTKGGFNALQTTNRFTTYVALPGKVLIISLNLGVKTQVEYRRTYEMLLNSLSFIKR